MSKRNQGQFDAFVQAYAIGTSVKEFCKLKHISHNTVRKWTVEPGFKRAVAAIRAELYEAFIGTLVGTMKEAAEGMLSVARNGAPDSVRLAAWRGIVDDLMKMQSVTKLEQDVAEMKATLAAAGGTDDAKVDSGS